MLKGADSIAMEDKIGRQEFVGKICGLVDSLKKDNHTCIAINGDWGSGKSFVLGMIEEQLHKKQKIPSLNTMHGRTLSILIHL